MFRTFSDPDTPYKNSTVPLCVFLTVNVIIPLQIRLPLYHRRKVVWDKIAELVRAGCTADAAIDRICSAYGVNASVTAIINQMRRDRQHGGRPDLRA